MKTNEKFIQKKQLMVGKITELITKEGYENLTIRAICKELDISTGTFYHYFPDKNDLIKVLFTDIDDYFEHTVSKEFTISEAENLLCFTKNYGEYCYKNGVETCRQINVAPLKAKDHKYLEEDRAIFQILCGIFTRGSKKQEFELMLSSEETARMFLVLLRGYSADWAKQDGSYDLIEKLEQLCTMYLKAIQTK